jgi:hypothetical protein
VLGWACQNVADLEKFANVGMLEIAQRGSCELTVFTDLERFVLRAS